MVPDVSALISFMTFIASMMHTTVSAVTSSPSATKAGSSGDAALKKVGINPAHVDSDAHIESNMAKGWITADQAAQAREIIAKVGAEKAANLPEQMVQNIANGRVQKFLKENTLEEQEYQMGDGKISVKAAINAVDKEAKVIVFKRFSLSD